MGPLSTNPPAVIGRFSESSTAAWAPAVETTPGICEFFPVSLEDLVAAGLFVCAAAKKAETNTITTIRANVRDRAVELLRRNLTLTAGIIRKPSIAPRVTRKVRVCPGCTSGQLHGQLRDRSRGESEVQDIPFNFGVLRFWRHDISLSECIVSMDVGIAQDRCHRAIECRSAHGNLRVAGLAHVR